jgi:acyl-CoA thioester hydrolase
MVAMQPTPTTPITTTGTASKFFWPVRVYWEDTDAGGIVFYANYLKYFERARTEWLRSLGLEQWQLQSSYAGIFVVSEANIKYLRSARLDDQLLVSAQLSSLGRSSLIITQEVRLREQSAARDEEALLCTGSVRVGWVDRASLRPSRFPTTVQDALRR